MAKLNVEHINKILAHIRGDLRRLWMPAWGVLEGSEAASDNSLTSFSECGTACCFAGWSKLLSMPRSDWGEQFNSTGYMRFAEYDEGERLGLNKWEGRSLFDAAYGTPADQLQEVEERLREIVEYRIECGEESAREVNV